jgi:hypothetical protein
MDTCPAQGCDVALTLSATLRDWPAHDVQSWLQPSGVWLRASDVLPTLGLNPDRRLRIPAERAQFGLPELADNLPRHAMQAAKDVAPAGTWHWSVVVDAEGVSTQTSGSLTGPLDFAMVWLPKMPEQTPQNGVYAWHGHEYRQAAKDILEDLQLMAQGVGDLLGQVPDVRYVIQVPRELGEIAVHGELLWLPENLGWDIASEGPGRKRRRAAIASALSRHVLLRLLICVPSQVPNGCSPGYRDGSEWNACGAAMDSRHGLPSKTGRRKNCSKHWGKDWTHRLAG